MDERLLILLFGFTTLFGACASEYCYSIYEGGFYCTNGCCGEYLDEDCCAEPFPVYIIVLIVVGAIFVISITVCLVCVLCVKKTKTGRVIQPSNQNQFQVHTMAYVVHPPGYDMYPPPPPVYHPGNPTPNESVLHNEQQEMNRPDGISSEPPNYSGLPGNHRVV